MLNQCPTCDKTTGMEILKKEEEFEIRGEKIIVPVQLYHCKECDSSFTTNDLEDPFKAAYREYRRLNGMVQPEQISEFRNKYGLTQKELSDLLGFGGVTLSRYENGSLQDLAHDRMLKLAMEPRNLLELLNKDTMAIEAKKKAEIINELLEDFSPLNIVELSLTDKQPNEFNGFTTLQIKKIAEVIKSLCFNKEIFITKLMKLFFYSDFLHYKKFHTSITGFNYVHLNYGPVPDKYEIFIGVVLVSDPQIDLMPVEFRGYEGEVVLAKVPPKIEYLSETEIETLNFISKKFDRLNSKQISKLSHDEDAYKLTSMGEHISYRYAETLSIS